MTLDLDHLEAVARAATPGPWRREEYEVLYNGEGTLLEFNGDEYYCEFSTEEDAEYIATFDPVMVLAMIEALREKGGK